MTENEAIKYLNVTKDFAEENSVGGIKRLMCDTAITALKEIQQYRAIGTVEECLEAVEKQKAMKVNVVESLCFECPSCKELISTDDDWNTFHYCPECGQAINWEESEEE